MLALPKSIDQNVTNNINANLVICLDKEQSFNYLLLVENLKRKIYFRWIV